MDNSVFEKHIQQFSENSEKDIQMLKWAEVKRKSIAQFVNFKDRTVLDVGCSVGYISMWAAEAAKYVVGMDVRSEIIRVAEAVRKELMIAETKVLFSVQDWREHNPPATSEQNADIVMCTGLLHYFHREEYGEAIAKLVYTCKETLILEMKVKKDIDDKPRIFEGAKEGSTIPTFKWLKRTLVRCGFRIIKRVSGTDWPAGGEGRELWILKRLPEVSYKEVLLSSYAQGQIVEVPINHPALNYYYKTVERGTADWWIWVGHVAKNFKPWLFLPLVFQKARDGMSDGGHRLMVAKRLGHTTVKVRIM